MEGVGEGIGIGMWFSEGLMAECGKRWVNPHTRARRAPRDYPGHKRWTTFMTPTELVTHTLHLSTQEDVRFLKPQA